MARSVFGTTVQVAGHRLGSLPERPARIFFVAPHSPDWLHLRPTIGFTRYIPLQCVHFRRGEPQWKTEPSVQVM